MLSFNDYVLKMYVFVVFISKIIKFLSILQYFYNLVYKCVFKH